MVLAEKIATAIARGTANTRWRDFVDLYSLANRHRVSGSTFRVSLDRVAQYRKLTLAPLASLLVGYSGLAQTRWIAWLRKQRLESTIPPEFSAVLDYVVEFADPIIADRLLMVEIGIRSSASGAMMVDEIGRRLFTQLDSQSTRFAHSMRRRVSNVDTLGRS